MLKKMLDRLFSPLPFAIVSLFFIDRLSKVLVDHYLELGEYIRIFPGLNILLAYNTGAAFSFLSDASGWQQTFFIILGLIVSGIIIFWLQSTPKAQKIERIGLMLILSGAIGNLYDRIQYGFVIDFIDVYYANLHWPTFNIADSAICVGAGLLLVRTIKK